MAAFTVIAGIDCVADVVLDFWRSLRPPVLFAGSFPTIYLVRKTAGQHVGMPVVPAIVTCLLEIQDEIPKSTVKNGADDPPQNEQVSSLIQLVKRL